MSIRRYSDVRSYFGSRVLALPSLTAVMYMHQWPWKLRPCENLLQSSPDRSGIQVPCHSSTNGWSHQCWTCFRYFCEQCTCDSCPDCGYVTCVDCFAHHKRVCLKSWMPFLHEFPQLQCTDCHAPIDLTSHHCEICYLPQCLNVSCISQLVSCNGLCRRDICDRRSCGSNIRSYRREHFEGHIVLPRRYSPYVVSRQRFCLRDVVLIIESRQRGRQ